MVHRIRIIPKRTVAGTGTAVVAWGPNFGAEYSPGITRAIGMNLDLEAVAIAVQLGIAVSPRITALAATYNEQGIAIDPSGDLLATYNPHGIAIDPSGALLATYNAQGIAIQPKITALAATYNAQGIGVHLSGVANGAPYWMAFASDISGSPTGTGVDIPLDVLSLQVGDFMVAFIGSATSAGTNPAVTAPSGWTNQGFVSGNTTDTPAFVLNMRLTCFTKVYDGTEADPANFTIATAGTMVGEIHRVIGINGTTPFGAIATASRAGSDVGAPADPVSPSVVTPAVNCMVFSALWHSHLALANTHAAVAGHDKRSDTLNNNVPAAQYRLNVNTRIFAAAAATGTFTHDCSETVATDACLLRVAIRRGSVILAP